LKTELVFVTEILPFCVLLCLLLTSRSSLPLGHPSYCVCLYGYEADYWKRIFVFICLRHTCFKYTGWPKSKLLSKTIFKSY